MPPATRRCFRTFAAAALAALAASAAHAQYTWEAVRLHPGGAYSSQAYAAGGGLLGGYVELPGQSPRPALWGSAGQSWIDMTPEGFTVGRIEGMDATRQVGTINGRASLWHGTPESWVDLWPGLDWADTVAYGVGGDQQVGFARLRNTGDEHASLWYGSAQSFVDLHPSNAEYSRAYATDGVQQGGVASMPGIGTHAVLWSGSASSMVDLNPEGANRSLVRAMAAGVQAGHAYLDGIANRHAALWRGSAGSFIDLNPPGSAGSDIFATDGERFAGWAFQGGQGHAGVWLNDDPASYVDLHGLLGPGYFASVATGVMQIGNELHVSGYALGSEGPYRAWLWIGTVPAPGVAPALVLGLGLASKRRRRR